MQYAKVISDMQNMGFVIKWERDDSRLFFMSYDKYVQEAKKGSKSVKISDLELLEELINIEDND